MIENLKAYQLLWSKEAETDTELKKRWSRKEKITVNSTYNAMEYFKTFDIAELLEIDDPERFTDLFDENKTANIFKKEDSSVYLYKTNGSKSAMDIVEVVRQLRGLSYSNAVSYISEMFDIEVGTSSERIKEINNNIDDFQHRILTIELKDTSPETHKLLKDGRTQYGRDIADILKVFKHHIIEVDGEPRMISSLSCRELSIRIYGSDKKKNKIQRVLHLMNLLEIIDKKKNQDVPKDILDELLNFQKSKHYSKRADVYEVLQLKFDFFKSLEVKAEDINSKGVTSATLTRDGIINTFGQDKGNSIFVQDTNKPTTDISKQVEKEALYFIMEEIKKNEFIEEKEILTHLSLSFGKYNSTIKLKQVRTQLIEGYGLERCRLNKELKKEFGVTDNYTQTQSPTIWKIAD